MPSLGSVSGSLNLDAGQAVAQVESLIRALENLQQTAGRDIQMNGLQQGTSRAAQQADALARSYQQAGTIATGAFVGMVAIIGGSVAAAGQLEQAVTNVSASLGGLNSGQIDALTSSMQQLGSESSFSATEVAGVADALAKAGFGLDEIIGGMTEAVVDLSEATGASLTSSVSVVTAAMNTWDESLVGTELALTDAAKAADVFTTAANASSADIDGIGAGMRNLGPIAAMLGISFEEAAAGVALFTNYGLKGADAGISLARGLQNLARPTAEVERNLAKLGLSLEGLGIQAFDLQGNFVGLPALFEQLQSGLGRLDQQTQLAALSMIFGAEAIDVMGIAVSSGAGPLEQLISLMGETGVASEQAALRTDTFQGAMQRMMESVTTLGGSLAGPLLGPLQAAADGIATFAAALNAAPAPVQNLATGLVVVGTAILGVSAALLLGSAAVLKYSAAWTVATGALARGALAARGAMVALASNPLTAILGAIALVGGLVVKSFMDQKAAADDYRQSVSSLEMTLEQLRRQGDRALADLGEGTSKLVDELVNMERTLGDSAGMFLTPGGPEQQAIEEQADAIRQLSDEANLATPVMEKLNEALGDPNVDAEAFLNWSMGLLEAARNTETATDDVVALQTILDRPLSDFPRLADPLADSLNGAQGPAEDLMATLEEFNDVFSGMDRFEMDDLRIDGLDQQAAEIEELGKAIEDTFTRMRSPEQFGLGSMGAAWQTEVTITKDQMDVLGQSWDRLQEKMATGDFDNARIMADVLKILNDTDLDAGEKVAAIDAIAGSLDQYVLGMETVHEAQMRFLENGDNILEFWRELDSQFGSGGAKMDDAASSLDRFGGSAGTAGEGMRSFLDSMIAGNAATGDLTGSLEGLGSAGRGAVLTFEDLVDAAISLNDAADDLDSVLRTFEQIDALGQRSSTSEGIASALIGSPGEIGVIQDLLDQQIISVETYNAAISAGIRIQESDARVQQQLNKIRADQIPLLAAQQEAYEANITRISGMTAEQQQMTLALQDSAVQQQIAAQYALAYSASIGEIPKEVATSLIVEAAEADPILKSILLQMGLITETDGVVSVTFPEGESVTDAINELTDAVNALTVALGGVPSDVPGPEAGQIRDRTAAMREYAEAVLEANGGKVPEPGKTPPGYVGPTEDAPQSTLPPKETTPRQTQTKPPPPDVDYKQEGGPVTTLPNVGGGSEEGFRTYLAGLLQTQRATGQWQQTVARITSALPRNFQNVGVGAVAGLKPITSTFQTAPQQWAAPVMAATRGINTGFATNIRGLAPIASAGFGGAKTAAIGQSTQMRTGVIGATSGMAGGVISQASLMKGGVTGQTGAMSSGAIGHSSAMSGGVIGATGGMAGGVIGQAAMMAGGAIGQAGAMNTGVVGSSMGMAGGATAAAMMMAMGLIAGTALGTMGVQAGAARWPAIVAATAGPMAAAGQAAGSAAGMGVAAGLNSAHGAVAAAAARIVATVNAALQSAARIASPSKLTAITGRMMGLGLGVGLDSTTAYNEAQARSLVGNTLSAMTPGAFSTGGYMDAGGMAPGAAAGGGNTYLTIAPVIQMTGTVYGMEDFEAKVEDVALRRAVPVITSAIATRRKGKGR